MPYNILMNIKSSFIATTAVSTAASLAGAALFGIDDLGELIELSQEAKDISISEIVPDIESDPILKQAIEKISTTSPTFFETEWLEQVKALKDGSTTITTSLPPLPDELAGTLTEQELATYENYEHKAIHENLSQTAEALSEQKAATKHAMSKGAAIGGASGYGAHFIYNQQNHTGQNWQQRIQNEQKQRAEPGLSK
jgi:hypothetical protein